MSPALQPLCGCGKPVNGTVICRTCVVGLETSLVTIATMAPDLDVALAKQAQFGGTPGGRQTEAPLPFDAAVSETASVVRSTLAAWCDELWDTDFTRPARDLAPMALWLLARLARIAVHDEAGDCCDQIGDAAAQAWRAVDRPPERRYAGPCGICHRPMYVKPGRAVVTCREHEPPWTGAVNERREWMLGEAAAARAHAAAAVRILAVLEIRISAVQITRWAKAGRLTGHGTSPDGRTLYRIGDLIALAATRGREEQQADELTPQS
jgi:hypothetical protein